jgi:hypothetical protein
LVAVTLAFPPNFHVPAYEAFMLYERLYPVKCGAKEIFYLPLNPTNTSSKALSSTMVLGGGCEKTADRRMIKQSALRYMIM